MWIFMKYLSEVKVLKRQIKQELIKEHLNKHF